MKIPILNIEVSGHRPLAREMDQTGARTCDASHNPLPFKIRTSRDTKIRELSARFARHDPGRAATDQVVAAFGSVEQARQAIYSEDRPRTTLFDQLAAYRLDGSSQRDRAAEVEDPTPDERAPQP